MRPALLHRCAAAFALAASLATSVLAQGTASFPTKPIRIIVPYGPGTAVDAAARAVETRMAASWGQSVVVDNRPGANGVVATQAAAKMPADGYTMLLGAHATMAINPHVYTRTGYDPVKDFAPVGGLFTAPYVLVVHPSVPAASTGELIELARKSPGSLTYASYGVASGSHIAAELFATMSKVKLTHVPYKVGSITDLISGQVQLSFEPVAVAGPHIRAGKVRALGVTGPQRVPVLPEVPPIADVLPGYESTSWSGLFVPAGTPPPVIDRLSRELSRIVSLPEVGKYFEGIGVTPFPTGSAELGSVLRTDLGKYKLLVEATNIRLE